LDRRLGWPQSRSGRGGEKNSQLQPGVEIQIIHLVAQRYTTELYRHLLLNRAKENIMKVIVLLFY
jgi:hypothetical protein